MKKTPTLKNSFRDNKAKSKYATLRLAVCLWLCSVSELICRRLNVEDLSPNRTNTPTQLGVWHIELPNWWHQYNSPVSWFVPTGFTCVETCKVFSAPVCGVLSPVASQSKPRERHWERCVKPCLCVSQRVARDTLRRPGLEASGPAANLLFFFLFSTRGACYGT